MLYSILVGGTAGWLAGKIFRGKGFGFFLNIIIGIVGGFIGNRVFSFVNINTHGFTGDLITGVIGAGILFWIISIFKR